MANKKKHTGDHTDQESKTVLLLIDIISDFEFENGAEMFEYALPTARNIAELKKKAEKAKIATIYINDNFGKWRDGFKETIKYCLKENVRGCEIAKMLKPDKNDYFVLKPKHSAFYSTALDLLLGELKADTLIICGYSTNICVLFTANDAYMRGYKLFVPEDCVAAVKPKENKYTLNYIERVLKADTRPSAEIDFDKLV